MDYLKVKNWDEYQHYKDRCPPWIKLHTKILNDRAFAMLSCASRGLLMQLWILASEHDGKVPNDLEEIKFRLRDNTIKAEDVNRLISLGFLNSCKHLQADDSNVQASAVPETETETEKSVFSAKKSEADFNEWYAHYPLKKSRQAALKKWLTLDRKGSLPDLPILLAAVEQQKREKESLRESGKFCPEWKHPSTWLNKGCWEDEIESTDCYEEPAEKYLGEN